MEVQVTKEHFYSVVLHIVLLVLRASLLLESILLDLEQLAMSSLRIAF
jgi:hypothetical protein